MGSATVTELPLRLHRVEPDPFIESTPGPDEVVAPPPRESDDEGRVRGRLAELAA
jgi:hypothetical protein